MRFMLDKDNEPVAMFGGSKEKREAVWHAKNNSSLKFYEVGLVEIDPEEGERHRR
ncbi:MAG: hypothetical protein OXH76_09370 [Boseongicola sp.]|nr:hypothetical protein [Boseongicola sp.]